MDECGMDYAAFFIFPAALILLAQIMYVLVGAEGVVDHPDKKVCEETCRHGDNELGQQELPDGCRAYRC